MRLRGIAAVVLIASGAAVFAGISGILPRMLGSAGLSNGGGVPSVINHQGMVAVNGLRFTGTGTFRFAIVDAANGVNLWTNDNTQVGGSNPPTAGVSLTVADGIYSVALGQNMTAVSPSVFANSNTALRVWFDDGSHGNQQLSPDQKLASVPYAMAIADGAVGSAKLSSEVAIVPVGTLVATALSNAPAGWLLCDGSAVSRATYAALFAGVGSTYGSGDGSTTFNLPDLRGRTLVALDNMGGTDAGRLDVANNLGSTGGTQKHTLSVAEMPAHKHTLTDPGHWHQAQWLGSGSGSQNGWFGSLGTVGNWATGTTTTGITMSNTGNGEAHNIMQPYMLINYIIKY